MKGGIFSVTQKQSVKVCAGKLQHSPDPKTCTCQNHKKRAHFSVPLTSAVLFKPGDHKAPPSPSAHIVRPVKDVLQNRERLGLLQAAGCWPHRISVSGQNLLVGLVLSSVRCSVEVRVSEDNNRCYAKRWIHALMSLGNATK
jgi:hypothetical protein